jgi:two-component system, chemotaxis family, CheB/CheR fusion protein
VTDKPGPDASFEALLQFLKVTRGFDFTGYKRPSLERRFRRRIDIVGCKGFADYVDYLEVHPEEYEQLFDTLLINVTDFFRDDAPWQLLREEALPAMLEEKAAEEPIRVWSAGCATGQEACTIAMILCELLGEQSYADRVKIYATDVDEEALNVARAATYSSREVENVPPDLRERYFERSDQRFTFRLDLRRTLIFGRNNLVYDAPISRLDLLVCRNTLMYLTAETQGHILRHFHFALRDTGLLMLGKSEMMITHRDLFEALDLNQRIFRKRSRAPSLQAQVAHLIEGGRIEQPATDEDRQALEAALEASPLAQLIVTSTGALGFANVSARVLFGIGPEHIGRSLADLPIAGDPNELRAALERALSQCDTAVVGRVLHRRGNRGQRELECTVLPLLSSTDAALGAAIVYEDVTRYGAMEKELEANRRDLEAAYEELQSTIDELETTNEELQSANEELQSTNEELETMNEELESTNEELETINDELRQRTGELNSVNEFLEAILTAIGVAVAVLDRNQRVQVWNRGAEDLWGLRQDEAAEQHFLGLDIGLGPERLAPALRAVLGGTSDKETERLEAVNRRGRTILCETTVMPLVAHGEGGTEVRGAIVLMEDHAGDGRGPA